MNKLGSTPREKPYSSPFMACSALLLALAVHLMLLCQFIDHIGFLSMGILTGLLGLIFTSALIKLVPLVSAANKTSHSASRHHYLMSCGSAAIGFFLLLLGVSLRYIEVAHGFVLGLSVLAGGLEVVGVGFVWFAATLAAPINFTGIGK